MAQNRKSLHTLAEYSGLSYAECKLIMWNIMANTPLANGMVTHLISSIQKNADLPPEIWRVQPA